MPGRLEFEHEVIENEAEQTVKDFEFGLVWKYGGDEQPEALATRAAGDEEEEVGAEPIEVEVRKEDGEVEDIKVKEEPMDVEHGRDQPEASSSRKSLNGSLSSPERADHGKGKGKALPGEIEEHEDELEVKLALLGIYFSKLDKREEAKDLIFDRALTEYKKVSLPGRSLDSADCG
jgi:transcriptional adapter 2-alpha